MGFRLPDNFNAPYHSATITEFWRRWHISLSTWLKDYLYISLGGNRHGAFRTYLNLIITMFLGGLWHGVGMTFIAWGLLHGVALALHKMWLRFVPRAKAVGSDMRPVCRIFATLLTFNLVAFGWLLFTAEDMTVVEDMLSRIAYNFSFAEFDALVKGSGAALIIMAVGYIMHALPRKVDCGVVRGISRIGFVGQALLLVVAIWMVMQCDALLAVECGAGGGLPMYAAF
jgi:D-alanyl-lipoteichoic acid acyltransferase DltB (MBOAT superfamily)